MKQRGVSVLMNDVSVFALAFVLFYRPLASGVTDDYGSDAVFGLVLCVSAVCWLASLVLEQRRGAVGAVPAILLLAFLAVCGLSIASASHLLPSLHMVWLFGTYALIFFMVVQHWRDETSRRLLAAVMAATIAAVAAYALLHYRYYIAAMIAWLHKDPDRFKKILGVSGKLYEDLVYRVETRRAFGNFITPNQLADFLIAGVFFCLVVFSALRRQAGGAGRRAVLLAVILVSVLALFLTKSKGGLIAFAFAVAVLLFLGGCAAVGPRLSRTARRLLLASCAAGSLIVLCLIVYAVAESQNPLGRAMRGSLGVRLGYWRTSLTVIGRHPLIGVGPGNWPEYYSLYKQPESEETNLPHNDYLQVAAGSGLAALALYVAFLASCIVGPLCLRGDRPVDGEPAADDQTGTAPKGHEVERSRRFTIVAILLASVAFSADYYFIRSFTPPEEGVPALLAKAGYIPYLVLYAVWVGVFCAVFSAKGSFSLSGGRGWKSAMPAVALVAGLAGFALHSGGEFCLSVGAIGTIVFFMLGIAVAQWYPKLWFVRPRPALRLAAFFAVAVFTMFACVTVLQRVMTFKAEKSVAESLRESLPESPPFAEKSVQDLDKSIEALQQASKALPMDADTICDLGDLHVVKANVLYSRGGLDESRMELQRALDCYSRAARLNPMKSKYWASLGRFYLMRGDARTAAQKFLEAARLSPSRPIGWFLFASTAQRAEGLSGRVCDAYKKALELDPRQYHERNKLEPRLRAQALEAAHQCTAAEP